MKKYILIVIIGLVIAGGVSASWWSDFFGTEELGKASTIYQPNILPEADSTYDLGSSAVRWANIYGDTFYGDGSNLTGVSGSGIENLNSETLGSIGDVSTSTLGYGHLIMWNGSTWQDTATSSLGISGTAGNWATSSSDYWLTIQDTADLTEGTNLYYTQARVWDDTWASTTLDTLLTNSQTAYAWGDHGIAGYASSTGMYAKYGTLADLQLAVSDDFHNLGGTDANTTYTAGTNITLTGTQFDVDDAFLKNNASDTTTGGITMLSGTTTSSFYIGNDLTVSGDTTIVDLYLTNEIVSGYTTTTLGLFTQANGHIGGNLTVDGTGHDSFSDFVANEHLDWTASVGTIHSDNYTNTTYTAGDFAHNSLSGLNDGDSYEHLTATQVAALHAESHNIASHSDTTATGAELDDLTDNSMVDTLHRHSELSASDGTPDRALVVNASGYVGIGTTTPNTLMVLHDDFGSGIYGDILTLQENTGNSGAGTGIRFRTGITSGGVTVARIKGLDVGGYDGALIFEVGNNSGYSDATTEMMRITNDGNVGIGTTTINSRLSIQGGGNDILNLFGGTGTEMVTVLNDGNVGIGTASPGYKLEVVGGTRILIDASALELTNTTVGSQDYISFTGDNRYYYLGKESSAGGTIFGGTSAYAMVMGMYYANSIQFATDNVVKVTIDGTGNVGIGDTTPSQKLDVAGNVRADDYLEYSRPIPKGEALPIIMNMKNKEDGTLDHKSFPSFTSKEIEISEVKDKEGKVVKEAKIITKESVSLSSQIKYLIKGMQEQQETIEELKIRIEELESSKKVMGVGDSCSPCEDLNWRQEFINWIKSYPLDN